jgi:hypothetical protein
MSNVRRDHNRKPVLLYDLEVPTAETPVKLASPQVFNEQGGKAAPPR